MTPRGKIAGRPKKEKSIRIMLTVSPEVHTLWTKNAEAAGFDELATWCRMEINKSAKIKLDNKNS